ncbi:hypothetical protein B0H14DRAFT_3427517 [Mycena olivaceomarginata]|nr:hypothetical protein B0H14DRAFT_3427517 [Mycena olivaceomarginata]
MNLSTLPPEICGVICTELKDLGGNLALLCRTSRNFRREAQRVLYHTVDLRGRKMRAVDSWAHTVTRNAHLAERVHALALQLPSIGSLDVSDVTKLVKALNKCINLKELRGAHEWMLSGCPFRLQKFGNLAPFEGRWDDDFWKTQTEIRVLSLPSLRKLPSFENQLLNVIALGTTTLDTLPARPLQRVETGFRSGFSPLAQYSQTLTTLSVRGWWASSIFSIPDILTSIAVSVPTLLHLTIIELKKMLLLHSPDSPTPILRAGFRKLKTFVLHVRNIERFWSTESDTPDSIDSNDYEMNYPPDLERLGVDILEGCPTLLRVAIGAEKEEGGAIHVKAGTALDFEALDMFWNP